MGDFFFFRLILDYLHEQISAFGVELLARVMRWVGAMALTLMTLWVLIQGFRIVTGRSRDSMMVLVTNMARAALIVGVTTSMAMFGRDLHGFLINDVKSEISHVGVPLYGRRAVHQIPFGLLRACIHKLLNGVRDSVSHFYFPQSEVDIAHEIHPMPCFAPSDRL
ncbi:hypothetical protein ABB34_06860 [Stenotrophomonas daejeonensis]|uniref:Uncharacterized protein n=1 Tax=Stenotrophomonas daejeonensis TaxID=659018 RepID=A0A0R0DWF6_9GAMM|nr:hypothetical protein ABB34_06860 [Stenotrophomonas daejeonensis]